MITIGYVSDGDRLIGEYIVEDVWPECIALNDLKADECIMLNENVIGNGVVKKFNLLYGNGNVIMNAIIVDAIPVLIEISKDAKVVHNVCNISRDEIDSIIDNEWNEGSCYWYKIDDDNGVFRDLWIRSYKRNDEEYIRGIKHIRRYIRDYIR